MFLPLHRGTYIPFTHWNFLLTDHQIQMLKKRKCKRFRHFSWHHKIYNWKKITAFFNLLSTGTYERYQLTIKKSHLQHLRQIKVQQMKLALAAHSLCGCNLKKSTVLIIHYPLSKDSSSCVDKKYSKQFQELLRHTSHKLILKLHSIKQFNNIYIIYSVL